MESQTELSREQLNVNTYLCNKFHVSVKRYVDWYNYAQILSNRTTWFILKTSFVQYDT